MLSGLFTALGGDSENTKDPEDPEDPENPEDPETPDSKDPGTEKSDSKDSDKSKAPAKKSLGASDTANVVKTLAVVSNSVPPAVLRDPATRNSILSAINDFAGQDDDFVQDAGKGTASA